jgi:hypothetical protein
MNNNPDDTFDPGSIPAEVMFLKMAAKMNYPVGVSMYERIISAYPEHFVEVHEHRRKWQLVPQSVHDAYNNEYSALTDPLYKSVPHWGKGIYYLMQASIEEQSAHHQRLAEIRPELNRIKEELKTKHYEPYGVRPQW